MQLLKGFKDKLNLIKDTFKALTAPNTSKDKKEATTAYLGRVCYLFTKQLAK